MGKSFQIIFSKSLGLSQNTKQGVSAVSRNALFFRKCSYACCDCYSSKSQSGSGTGGQAHLFPLHGRKRSDADCSDTERGSCVDAHRLSGQAKTKSPLRFAWQSLQLERQHRCRNSGTDGVLRAYRELQNAPAVLQNNDSRFEKLSVDYEMSKQNCRRASLPKCSLMHQKAEQRDFRHAVLSKPYKPVLCATTRSGSFFHTRKLPIASALVIQMKQKETIFP